MSDIAITNHEQTPTSHTFTVTVGDAQFEVTLDNDYYQELTGGDISPEELVQRSFAFLLEREPKSAILPAFDLRVIENYFSEYEAVMKSRGAG